MSWPSKLTVASTFGIYPPRGGGQLRIFHLMRHLAGRCPVEVVALVAGDEPPLVRKVAPGLTEVRIPKSAEHATAEAELERDAGVPVTDVVFPALQRLTPAFSEAVRESAVAGGALVASHPYTLPALESVSGSPRIWYDAHNVEADLKAAMLAPNDVGRKLLSSVRDVECTCCERAELVWATCEEDAGRLSALYGVGRTKVLIVPNGIDCSAIRFTPAAERRDLRARLRVERPMALFLGSWHEPNLAAVRRIFEFASWLPDVEFAIVGSVCIAFEAVARPTNVRLFGIVDDGLKDALLSVASVALNPMAEGSGTNMKMLDYLAAGVPVVSTVAGGRGLSLDPDRHVRITSLDRFVPTIIDLINEPADWAEVRARDAQHHVEECFDWAVVTGRLATALGGTPEGRLKVAEPRTGW